MSQSDFETISADRLQQRLDEEHPDNDSRDEGYALVNVLGKQSFEHGHIPHSINIPQGNEDVFERRFSRDKEIIVYCASSDCDASPKAARELVRRGFTNVKDFDSGLEGWKDYGNALVGGTA